MLTILVLIVSSGKSFSKFKVIKPYLKSIMSQQKLMKLILLFIKKYIINEIYYDNLVYITKSSKI